MNRFVATVLLTILGASATPAQTLRSLDLQAHGYVAQGFVLSTANEWDTTDSSHGSAAWTDAVVNVTSRPKANLRLGVQGRYFLLGNLGNAITLDWAQADVKFNEHFGLRAGKVKSPTGLFNEEQDIDPAYLWVLLPQSVYPIASRNSLLSHYGGVVYGRAVLGERLGKLQYRGFGGERVIASNDGFLRTLRDAGVLLPQGLKGPVFGGTLRWETPVRGMMFGASENVEQSSGPTSIGSAFGIFQTNRFYRPFFFTRYEHDKINITGEYSRFNVRSHISLIGLPPLTTSTDTRLFYIMASHPFTRKLAGGLYYSSTNDRAKPLSAARYQKDWALCARYDATAYLYVKFEQHIIDGTRIGYSIADNPNGLQPNARMSLFKMGVSF